MLLAVSLLLAVLLIGAALAVLAAELWPHHGRRLWRRFGLGIAGPAGDDPRARSGEPGEEGDRPDDPPPA